MRYVMTRVLPLPAPARMSTGPSVVSTASRCCGLSGSRKDNAEVAPELMIQFYRGIETDGSFPLSEQHKCECDHVRECCGKSRIHSSQGPWCNGNTAPCDGGRYGFESRRVHALAFLERRFCGEQSRDSFPTKVT